MIPIIIAGALAIGVIAATAVYAAVRHGARLDELAQAFGDCWPGVGTSFHGGDNGR